MLNSEYKINFRFRNGWQLSKTQKYKFYIKYIQKDIFLNVY